MYQLRDYQKIAVEKSVAFMKNSFTNNGIIVLPTGSGKSLVIAGIAQALDEPTIIFQPSKEILEQNYAKYTSYGNSASIWSASLGIKEMSKVTFATIGSVRKIPHLFQHFKYIIVDECFPEGTLVDGRPIETLRIGDEVNSYNHKTNRIERKKVVWTSKQKCPRELVLIYLNGVSILGTLNHPVYIKGRGYTKLKDIRKGDIVYAIKTKLSKRNSMFRVPKTFKNKKLPPVLAMAENRGNIPQRMLSESEWKKLLDSYAKKQSYGFGRDKKENECNLKTNRSQTTNSRWKWKSYLKTTKNALGFIRRRMVCRTRYKNQVKTYQRIPLSLQNRYSKPYKYDSYRSRWKQPLFKENSRFKEGSFIEETRVERIEIQKQGYTYECKPSDKPDCVYNLEIEDNNNYFANGILVHNCHLVNSKGGMYKEFIQSLGHAKVLGLTATPYRLTTDGWGGSILKFITRTRPRIFSEVIFYVQNSELFDAGHLAKLEYFNMKALERAKIKLNSTGADYDESALKRAYEEVNFKVKTEDIIRRLVKVDRKNILVFLPFISEARYLASKFNDAEIVTGETPKAERERIINGFKAGKIRTVCNVGVLTTGFDYPELSTVILARPTMSLSLYYQMIGRAIRPHESKKSAWIIDMCENCNFFGKIETLKLNPGINGKWYVSNNGKTLTNIYYGDRK